MVFTTTEYKCNILHCITLMCTTCCSLLKIMCFLCTLLHVHNACYYTCFNERGGRKNPKQDQANNKAKQHNTPKAVTFPKKNELPHVGLEPTALYTLDRTLYQLSYQDMYMMHTTTCT